MSGRLLLAVGVLSFLVACSPRPVRSSDDLAQSENAMFEQVAEELAKLAASPLQAGGRVLVVRGSAACTAAAQQDFLEQSLRKQLGGAEVVVVPQPDVKPPREMPDLPISPQPLTAAWLAQHVKQHKPAVVICLYSEPDAGVGVPLVCHSPAGPPKLAELIKSGAVLGAVTSAHRPAKDGSGWFDQRYTVLTRDNVGAW